MKSIQLLFVLILTLALVTSCKKDDEPEAAPTKTQLLTAKAWKLDKITASGFDVTSLLGAEVLGELGNSNIQFKTDGTYTSTNRTTNASTNGKWEFNTDQTQIILDKGSVGEMTLDVTQLTDKNLDLQEKINKNDVDMSQIPAEYQLIIAAIPNPINVDIKLIPAQ
jgi:hypothetical protein